MGMIQDHTAGSGVLDRVSAHLPDSLLTWGAVEVRGSPALTAGAVCDLEVRVSLRKVVQAGLSLEVWTHFVSDLARAQAEDPARPAWFSCESRRVLRARAYPEAKVHGAGSFFPYRRYAAIELPEGGAPGDEFSFRFRNVRMQTYEETLFNLRFAVVASESAKVIGYLGDAFYQVAGGPPASLWLVAPTCVEVGERFACRIVTCDRYGNKTGEDIADLAFEVEVAEGPVSAGEARIAYDPHRRNHTVAGLICRSEGVSYLHARVSGTDPAVAGTSNPVVARAKWGERLFWGDLHQHAYLCDGRGTPAANYEYAISTAGLDFCSVTPHEEAAYSPPWVKLPAPAQRGWEEMIEAAERFTGPEFVAILGAEPGGLMNFISHVNVYYLDHANRPVSERLAGPTTDPPDPKPRVLSYRHFLDELSRTRGEYLLLPHAHARGGPGVYDLPVLPDIQTNVEICAVHGVFEEFYRQWLKHGHYVGVHGGGDNHMTSTGNANPGYHYSNTNGLAAAWAPGLTRRGIWDAFKHRRTYAVTGNQRIFLELRADEEPMGTVIVGGARPRDIRVKAAGTAPILRLDLLRNGEVVHAYRPVAARRRFLRLTWTDDWCSRRVDESLTTGTIAVEGATLKVSAALNAFHLTDAWTARDGAVDFRSNACSGITRGLIAEVTGSPVALRFAVRDLFQGKAVLDTSLALALDGEEIRAEHFLDLGERKRMPLFSRELHRPRFMFEAVWVDPVWPKTATLDWTDEDAAPAYYTARMEQIDGNIAWSSPIWFRDRSPEPDVPGRVVRR